MPASRLIVNRHELEKYRDYFLSEPFPKFIRFYHSLKMELDNLIPYAKFSLYVKETDSAKYYFGMNKDEFHTGDRSGYIIIEYEGSFNFEDFIAGFTEAFPNPRIVGMVLARKIFTDALTKFISEINPEYGPVRSENATREFYTSKDQVKNVLSYKAPEWLKEQGFELTVGDPEKDAEIINSTWQYSTADYVKDMEAKLKYLPNVCIKKDGFPISYEGITIFGKICHQYTVPEYRNRGLGTIVERELMKKIIEVGMNPIKEVNINLTNTVRRANESNVWTISREDDGTESTLVYFSLGRRG